MGQDRRPEQGVRRAGEPAASRPVGARPAAGPPKDLGLRRRRSGRMVAGVAGGIADHLGVDVGWVRGVFVLLTALGGSGVLAYGLLWIFVRQEPDGVARVVTARERQQAVGLVALGIGLALAASALGNTAIGWVVGPLGVALVGAAVVWREADRSRRQRWAAGARSGVFGGGGRMALLRVVLGALFVATGITVFLLGSLDLGQVQFGLLAVLATLVGVGVLTVPWWVRLMRELREERLERVRSTERAEIAAHLHDSVLQTLALIQRQADSAKEVRRLARGQERDLRNWLYGPTGYGRASGDGVGTSHAAADDAPDVLSEALAAAAAEVEDTYAVTVKPVLVGDAPMDERLHALVAASREAMVNAAKHAQVGDISLYAEVEPESVHVFVRDRGVGFDTSDVPDDRHGLANSVRGRMERFRGTVKLRSAAGEGTEVQLEMPRASAEKTDDKAGEAR